MFSSVRDFDAMRAAFVDGARTEADNAGPHVLVVDDLYEDPNAVREIALRQTYVQYAPPSRDMVDAETYAVVERRGVTGRWMSTSLRTFQGVPVRHPYWGYRYNPAWLRQRMEALTGDAIHAADWDPGGDWWNGAFHLRDADHRSGAVHHHHHASNIVGRGWSGVVYLSPDAPPECGTSFWRSKRSGSCVARFGEFFDYDTDAFERVYSCENIFNRLLLFRENVLHLAEPGFGQGDGRRLVQTFFFASHRMPA